MVADVLNSNGLRVLFYVLAAGACWIAGRRERTFLLTSTLDLWPRFWTLSAVLLLVMAFGRLTDAAGLLTQLVRNEALTSGWYEARRPLQAALVGSVAVGWFSSVATAIWRVPERRRRYLPTAVFVFSLVCFAAVRTISFHYADAILYNNPIAGVRIGSIIELLFGGCVIVAGVIRFAAPQRRALPRPAVPREASSAPRA